MVINQHLIDPESCIQCDTCEQTCPVNAISHDQGNYIVDPNICNSCRKCIDPCPTGAIDNWRKVPESEMYTNEVQSSWSVLPNPLTDSELKETIPKLKTTPENLVNEAPQISGEVKKDRLNSVVAPRSAAHPYINLFGIENAATAKVTGNMRVTEADKEYDTHHIILDMGNTFFPVLEGQSIGILPPGLNDKGRPHNVRLYSISSARGGEREGYNNFSLTVKRVLKNRDGNAVKGLASNYLCDLKVGETVQVTGPFGSTFLMPNHPGSNLIMICTGTGSAPMRAMLIQRNRQILAEHFKNGKIMLFFGARTPEELPFFGRLNRLPKDLVDLNLAFSRIPDQPKKYVQDVIKEQKESVIPLLKDPNTFIYICGLRSMEDGVVNTFKELVTESGIDWNEWSESLKNEGRIHVETY